MDKTKFLEFQKDKIFKECYEYKPFLDLSNKSVSLVMIGDMYVDRGVKSFLNSMAKVKFTDYLFFTSMINDPSLIFFKDLPVKVIKTPPLNRVYNYVIFLTHEVVKYLNTDYFLIIQWDGTILWQTSWTDEFLEYDYVGAPWSRENQVENNNNIFYNGTFMKYPKYSVGNGGFCLRSKRLQEEISKYPNINEILAERRFFEDIVICTNVEIRNHLENMGMKFAPLKLATKFSYEKDVGNTVEKWFGIHATKSTFIDRFFGGIDNEKLLLNIFENMNIPKDEDYVDSIIDEYCRKKEDMKFVPREVRGIGNLRIECNFFSYRMVHYEEQINNFESFIDLSNKNISLVIVFDYKVKENMLSFFLNMAKMKFTKNIVFSTSEYYDLLFPFKNAIKFVKIPKLGSLSKYSEFIVCRLWEYIDTDYVLIVQYDGHILYQNRWEDEFLKYDYIGAPWPKCLMTARINDPTVLSNYPGNIVGNGGFCLRSKKLLDFVGKYKNISEHLKRRGYKEDVLICGDKMLNGDICAAGLKIAPYNIAALFSYEFDTDFSVDEPFGIHGKYISGALFSSLNINNLVNCVSERYNFDIKSMNRIISK